jgi:hypothetical protein
MYALDCFLSAAIAINKANIELDRLMNLVDKMAVLRERAETFNRDTDKELNDIANKIEAAHKKRDEAAALHHAYLDGVITGIAESVAVIDKLSKGEIAGS